MTSDPASLQVRTMQEADRAAWDRFVQDHPEGTFFHLSGWLTVLREAFGHRSHALLVEDASGIRGLFPLARIRSVLFGDALISLPFCVYGGVLAIDESARLALEDAAMDLARELAVDHLEVRNQTPRRDDWLRKDLYVGFRKEIDPDPSVNLMAIPRKQRAEVRRGIRNELVSVIESDTDRCWQIYAESVRNLGTPVFSRRYFRVLKEVFGEACEARVVEKDGEAVSAVLSFYYKNEVLPYYGGALWSARRIGAYPFMYWDLMGFAAREHAATLFDFGRSKKGSGSYNFKRYYGFEPTPLAYEYHLVKADSMPNVSPTNPKYRLFIEMWKRLPVPVASALGPMIARHLG
ncbi:MAG: FemAB family PEP-CTERM system-associated protein [Magnetococcales bacterium]|nr:FemAB family PEP-CTERM system-associated protein [Magnetococcales bacterium]